MIALICGKREEGKTTRALSLAQEWSPRLLILDHRNQFDLGRVVDTPDELEEALNESTGTVVYRLELDVADGEDQEVGQVIEVVRQVWLRGKNNDPDSKFSFLIDEAGELMKNGKMARALHRMVRQIRLDTVQVFLLCHRPKDISTSFRSMITDLYLFNITDPLDVEWLEQAGVLPEHIEIVRHLPRYHHIHLVMRTRDTHFELYNQPETWNVPWKTEAVHA
jgi:hypothetical protein